MPFTAQRGGSAVWPGPGGPGYYAYLCDFCEQEVCRETMGGINVDWEEVRTERDHALVFHWRNCSKIPPVDAVVCNKHGSDMRYCDGHCYWIPK